MARLEIRRKGDTLVSLNLTKATVQLLDELAYLAHQTRSEVAELLLADALAREKRRLGAEANGDEVPARGKRREKAATA